MAETLTLDLGGMTLVGSGYGIGLRIERGGSDGALVVGGAGPQRAEIVGFRTGIVSTSPQALSRIEGIAVRGSRIDGLRLRTSGALLVNIDAKDNGGDGLRLYGRGGRLIGVEAIANRGDGLRLLTRGTIVEATTAGNGGNGVVSDGARNDLRQVLSIDNTGHGVVVRGGKHETDGLLSQDNARDDVRQAGKSVPRR